MDTVKHTSQGRGPKVTSIEVASFTTPGRTYRVYPDHGYCSCPHHVKTGRVCKHIKSLRAEPYTIVAVHDSRVPGVRYDIYGPEGYEGRCISYADAHDTIVHDLHGYVANYPGAA